MQKDAPHDGRIHNTNARLGRRCDTCMGGEQGESLQKGGSSWYRWGGACKKRRRNRSKSGRLGCSCDTWGKAGKELIVPVAGENRGELMLPGGGAPCKRGRRKRIKNRRLGPKCDAYGGGRQRGTG